MTKHRILINGIDIYSTYRAVLAEGAYNDILAFPAMKTPQSVVWEEEDGTDFDLTSPVLQASEFSISFLALDASKIGDFQAFLFSSVYLVYKIEDISVDRVFRVLQTTLDGSQLTVLLSDDASYEIPPLGLNETFPIPEFPTDWVFFSDPSNLTIDNIPLTAFNICALQEAKELFLQDTTLAEKIVTDSQYSTGKLYGTNNNLPQPPSTFTSKSVELPLIIKMPSSIVFAVWWEGFLRLLMLPGERTLQFLGRTYYVKYNSCKINSVDLRNSEILFTFVINIEILR